MRHGKSGPILKAIGVTSQPQSLIASPDCRDATVAKLQRKIQQLQEELTEKFRCVRVARKGAKAWMEDLYLIFVLAPGLCGVRVIRRDVQGATSQLGLTKENQELFKKLQDTRTE